MVSSIISYIFFRSPTCFVERGVKLANTGTLTTTYPIYWLDNGLTICGCEMKSEKQHDFSSAGRLRPGNGRVSLARALIRRPRPWPKKELLFTVEVFLISNAAPVWRLDGRSAYNAAPVLAIGMKGWIHRPHEPLRNPEG